MQVECRIPQLGEGLREVMIVQFLKRIGEWVDRDEPLYEMETDKAVTEVESPVAGQLVEWLVKEGEVLQVGTVVVRIETEQRDEPERVLESGRLATTVVPPLRRRDVRSAERPDYSHVTPSLKPDKVLASPVPVEPRAAVSSTADIAHTTDTRRPLRNADVSPRTRRFLKQNGLLEQARQIPASAGRLTPEDVSAWLAAQHTTPVAAQTLDDGEPFAEVELPRSQQKLNYRLQRSLQSCVPASITAQVDWSAIDRVCLPSSSTDAVPSAFTCVLWCVTGAMRNHAKLRSVLGADGKRLRTYRHVHLGIAVALPDDRLVTAVVEQADRLSWPEFNLVVRERIDLARQGTDQATAATTLSVSNIGSLGIRDGVPVVVPPAVATLTVGQTFLHPIPDEEHGFRFCRMGLMTLAFDHRVMNGLASGKFLNEIRERIEHFDERLP